MNEPIHDISEFEHALSLVRSDVQTHDFRGATGVLNVLVRELNTLACFAFRNNEYSLHLIQSCKTCSDVSYSSRATQNEGAKRFIEAIGSVLSLIDSMKQSKYWSELRIDDAVDTLMIDIDYAETKIKSAHALLHSTGHVWAIKRGKQSKRKPKEKIVEAVTRLLSENINLSAKELYASFDDGMEVYINEAGDVCQDGEGGGAITFRTFENLVSRVKSTMKKGTKNHG